MTKLNAIKIKKYLNFASKFIEGVNAFLSVFKKSQEQIQPNSQDVKEKILNEAVDFICLKEGFSNTAYKCPAGKWTIGHGLTELLKNLRTQEVSEIYMSQEESKKYVKAYVKKDYDYLKALEIKHQKIIKDKEYVAFLSFMYNFGRSKFASSTLFKHIFKTEIFYAKEFKKWIYIKGNSSDGLKKRREEEIALFLNDK
ncbi:MAG: hypothetical protein EVA43_03755 [Flavobacteriales bacterium]|nr:MAG: hypothetical protein EVA43_03755 [Flavobacteriales bacterium]